MKPFYDLKNRKYLTVRHASSIFHAMNTPQQTSRLSERIDDWHPDMLQHQYIVHEDDKTVGGRLSLLFLCPGCGALIGVAKPPWEVVDVEKLTARASILHTPPDGCGWHGYLTDGELRPC